MDFSTINTHEKKIELIENANYTVVRRLKQHKMTSVIDKVQWWWSFHITLMYPQKHYESQWNLTVNCNNKPATGFRYATKEV